MILRALDFSRLMSLRREMLIMLFEEAVLLHWLNGVE
jgi:hypothetical protein